MSRKKTSRQKFWSVLLALTLLLALVPPAVLDAAAAEGSELTFGVVNDLHYYPTTLMGEDMAAFVEQSRLNSSTSYLSDGVLDCVFAEYRKQLAAGKPVRYLLVPGDLTRNGELEAHKRLAERLLEFENETGIQVAVIDGNHDIRKGNASAFRNGKLVDVPFTQPEEFREIYKDLGYDLADAFFTPPAGEEQGRLSYAADLEGGYRLIALDAACYSADITKNGKNLAETRGTYSKALLDWALGQIRRARAKGQTVIGITHHNMVKHFDCEDSLFQAFPLDDWQYVCELLADAGLHFMFTGHIHVSDIASHVSDNGEMLTDCTTASTLNCPCYFRTVTMKTAPNGDITTKYEINDIDAAIPMTDTLGTVYERPFVYTAFKLNFGGEDIARLAVNMLDWQIRYTLKPMIEQYGSLYGLLNAKLNLDSALNNLMSGNEMLSSVRGLTTPLLKQVISSVCYQLERAYLDDPAHLVEVLDKALHRFASIPVSDYPCTKFLDTLGFGERSGRGTLGDAISTCMAYLYLADEDSSDDVFIEDVMAKLERGETAREILDTTADILLHDVLENEILKTVRLDIGSLLHGADSEAAENIIAQTISGVLETIQATGLVPKLTLMDVVNLVFALGIVDFKSLDEVVYSYLDSFLTPSEVETIAYALYEVMHALTQDSNPGKRMDNETVIRYTGKVKVKPTVKDLRLPSGIAVTFGDDSATARNICWYTKKSVSGTDIEIVPYSANPRFTGRPTTDRRVRTKLLRVKREFPGVDFGVIGILRYEFGVARHMIKLTGLKPGQKYSFRVGDASRGWWSEPGVIETADRSDSFTFLHMSDSQGGIERQYQTWADVVDAAFRKNPDSAFILHSGDLVEYGTNFKQWNWLFNTASGRLLDTALMPASGNHELQGNAFALNNNFLLSNVPEQNKMSGEYYSFDYNNAHFMILNTNDRSADNSLSAAQVEWLRRDAGASTKQWKIVSLHKAIYSNGPHCRDKDVTALRAQLSALMTELGVDMVLQGHDHVYMRTDVLQNNAVAPGTKTESVKRNGATYEARLDPKGSVYVAEGCAGVRHDQVKDTVPTDDLFPPAVRSYQAQAPTYSAVRIEGNKLFFNAYELKNGKPQPIDSFALVKGGSQTPPTGRSDGGQSAPVPGLPDAPDAGLPKTGVEQSRRQNALLSLIALPVGLALFFAVRAIRRRKMDAESE